jgi:hypothetical protein
MKIPMREQEQLARNITLKTFSCSNSTFKKNERTKRINKEPIKIKLEDKI